MRPVVTNLLLLGLCVSLILSDPAPARRKKRIKPVETTVPTQIEPPEPETTEVLLLLHNSSVTNFGQGLSVYLE